MGLAHFQLWGRLQEAEVQHSLGNSEDDVIKFGCISAGELSPRVLTQ